MKYAKQRERERGEREREMGERDKRATIHVNVISSTLSCVCDLPQVYFVYLKFDPIVFE